MLPIGAYEGWGGDRLNEAFIGNPSCGSGPGRPGPAAILPAEVCGRALAKPPNKPCPYRIIVGPVLMFTVELTLYLQLTATPQQNNGSQIVILQEL